MSEKAQACPCANTGGIGGPDPHGKSYIGEPMEPACDDDLHTWVDPEGDMGSGPSPGKSKVAMGLLRNTNVLVRTPPPSRSNWTQWVKLLLEGGPYPCKIR